MGSIAAGARMPTSPSAAPANNFIARFMVPPLFYPTRSMSGRFSRRHIPFCYCPSLLLQRGPVQRLHVFPERAAGGIAGVEHVSTPIDRELEAVGGAEHRHLIEDELGPEIGGDEIPPSLRPQGGEDAGGREGVAKIADDFRTHAPAAPRPLA